MSSKKDKYLESAQKFIVKGQLDRAILDYEQVVALDPNDIRHRQRLAELLVRVNRTIEAIGEYEAIGKYYADNGFYLKAIAVYKQVQKLDPDDIKTCLNLASLNGKQGLTGNALAEYGKVFSHLQKGGKLKEALNILESMIALDPDNINTRLKFAETRYSLGLADKGYDDFCQIAFLLRKRGDESAFNQVSDRIRLLFPEKKEFILELLASQIKSGDTSTAIEELQEITKKDPTNLNAWNLLLETYRIAGARDELKAALQKMVRVFPDTTTVRERLMQYALDDGDIEGGLYLLKMHGATLLEKGDIQAVERIYLGLLDLAPQDIRILQGLHKLYEDSGNHVRLAETIEKLDSLSGVGTRPHRESPGIEVPFLEQLTAPVEEVTEPLVEEEEEISLDLSEPGAVGPIDLAGAAEPDLTGTDNEQGAQVESEYPDEFDLEIEISVDEPTGLAQFNSETDAEESHSHGLSEESTQQAVSARSLSTISDIPEPELYPAGEGESVEPGAVFLSEAQEAAPVSTSEQDTYRPDEPYSAFRKGLDQQLDKGDTETRYNLGIAFKEMGLYDEAIAEFQAAAFDPQRRIDCLTLQGICCRDKGDYSAAEEIFKKGIGQEGSSVEEQLSIKYELALLYESAGRNDDALELYRQIQAERNDFRNTKKKIAHLQGSEELYDLDLVELEGDEGE